MKYFLHDSNSFNDEKITRLFIKFSYEGLGLFYTILEKLAQQEKPILTDVLKHQLKVGKRLEKVWKFIEDIELISSNNGETFNKQLLNFSEKYQIKKEKNTERIRKWRENQKDINNVTRYESVSNNPKVNKSKGKEKEKNIKTSIPEFSEFLSYALGKEPLISEHHLKLKYEAWIENGWKNGNDKQIKNWKSSLLNTIPHIEKSNGKHNTNTTEAKYTRTFKIIGEND